MNEALKDAIEFQEGMQEISDWLHEAENYLSIAPQISRLPDILLQQIDIYKTFNVKSFNVNQKIFRKMFKFIRNV